MMHLEPTDGVVKIVFIDGIYAADNSNLTALPKGAALSVEGQDYTLSLSDGTSLLLLEEHIGVMSQTNYMARRTDVILGVGAELDFLQWQNLPIHATHDSVYTVTQAANSLLRAGFFAVGGAREHLQLRVDQQGERAVTDLYGLCQPMRDGQHLQHSVDMLHNAPCGKSSMTYKGILDAESKAAFRGRVKVPVAGQGVEAHQSNHWLLLSNRAEAASQPELEIDQEDIRCSHGATVGQIDEASLFYLCGRGISRPMAESMLRLAFVSDIFERVPKTLLPWLRAEMGYFDEA